MSYTVGLGKSGADVSPARLLMAIAPVKPSPGVEALLRAANGLVKDMIGCPAPALPQHPFQPGSRLADAVSRLRHPLSELILQGPSVSQRLIGAQAEEQSLYQVWAKTTGSELEMSDVQRFVSLSTGGDGSFRRGRAWLRSRDGRIRTQLGDAGEAIDRLQCLLEVLRGGGLGEGVLQAVRALVLVNNAHPFPDGNGRLGRALFNYYLHLSGMCRDCFIPLKWLSVLARGGYEIRLREAELFGRWDGIISYHCSAIAISASLDRLEVAETLGISNVQ